MTTPPPTVEQLRELALQLDAAAQSNDIHHMRVTMAAVSERLAAAEAAPRCDCGADYRQPVVIHGKSCRLREAAALSAAEAECERLRLDAKLGVSLEAWICMNTNFTGEPPYVGDRGLLLAISELEQRATAAEQRAAELEADATRYRWIRDNAGYASYSGNVMVRFEVDMPMPERESLDWNKVHSDLADAIDAALHSGEQNG